MINFNVVPHLNWINTSLALILFGVGLFCCLTQRNILKQVIGLKIMLQGAALSLVHAGHLAGDLRQAQMMVISALVAETIVIALAIALIVNAFRHEPSGDIDRLDQLKG